MRVNRTPGGASPSNLPGLEMGMDDHRLAAALDAYRAKSCDGKYAWTTAGAASRHAATIRARGEAREAYRCHFCDAWHTGHPASLIGLERIAALLRARSGHAPSEPGTGTTRRQRRKEARRGREHS